MSKGYQMKGPKPAKMFEMDMFGAAFQAKCQKGNGTGSSQEKSERTLLVSGETSERGGWLAHLSNCKICFSDQILDEMNGSCVIRRKFKVQQQCRGRKVTQLSRNLRSHQSLLGVSCV